MSSCSRAREPLPPDEAQRLHESLRELRGGTESLAAVVDAHVHLCIHVGPVEVRGESTSLEVLGGPVTELASWAVRTPSGLHLTPSAVRVLGIPVPR